MIKYENLNSKQKMFVDLCDKHFPGESELSSKQIYSMITKPKILFQLKMIHLFHSDILKILKISSSLKFSILVLLLVYLVMVKLSMFNNLVQNSIES